MEICTIKKPEILFNYLNIAIMMKVENQYK